MTAGTSNPWDNALGLAQASGMLSPDASPTPHPSDNALSMAQSAGLVDTPQSQAPTPSPAPESTTDKVVDATLGKLAGGVQTVEGWVGKGAQAIGHIYDAAVGQPTAGTAWVAAAPKTVLEKAAQLEQVPETGLKDLALLAEGQPYRQNPTWGSVIAHLPGVSDLPDTTKAKVATDLGVIAEPLADPMLFINPLGTTAEGEEAAAKGLLEPNIANAGQEGQKALLTLGNKPIIQGQPVLDAIGKAQTTLREALPGFHTMTEDPLANKIVENEKISPMNVAALDAEDAYEDFNDMVDKNAQQMGTTPEALQTTMRNWIEPPGSQDAAISDADRSALVQGTRDQLGATLPKEIQDYLQGQVEYNQKYADLEGHPTRQAYLYHMPTNDWKNFLQENMLKEGQMGGATSPKQFFNPAKLERQLSNHTVDEVNAASQAGKLGDLYPDSHFKAQLNKFQGKVFEDNLGKIESERFLRHKSQMTTHEMISQMDNLYGKTKAQVGKIVGGQPRALARDWSWVPSQKLPGGGKYFPKPIGDYLKNVAGTDWRPVASMISKLLGKADRAVKLLNYGYWTGSALKNYTSNTMLAFLNRQLNPLNPMDYARYAKAIPMVARYYAGKLGDDVVLHSPVYGDVTSKQLFEMARAGRGIGMGPARAALGEKTMNPLAYKLYALHNFAEDASRLPVFMRALENGATVNGAGLVSRRTLFDYSNLGAADTALSNLAPFYRFARMNTPNILRKLVTDSPRVLAFEKFREAWNKAHGHGNDESMMNDWEHEAAPLYLFTDKNGMPHYVNTNFFNPAADVNHIFGMNGPGQSAMLNAARGLGKFAVSELNPVLKAPMEAAMNYDVEYGAPIDPLREYGGESQAEPIPGVRTSRTAAKMLSNLRPFSAAQGMSSPANKAQQPWEKWLHLLGGLNINAVDTQRGTENAVIGFKDKVTALEKQVRSYGRARARDMAAGNARQAAVDEDNMKSAISLLRNLVSPGSQR